MNTCHALEDDGPFPYSLDLLPYDVHVFSSLRKTLKNCRFKLEEEGFEVVPTEAQGVLYGMLVHQWYAFLSANGVSYQHCLF
jgi:hypothetical protein